MRALVTGVAGFIGSALAERLVTDGFDVVGVDCFTPSYDEAVKRRNVDPLVAHDRFELATADLRDADLGPLLDGADYVFHEAAEPGVRQSSRPFADYASHNVVATERLLEAAVAADVRRFVYASSSAVYGRAPRYPTTELDLPQPHTAYAATKLAGEHLCNVYAESRGLPTVVLRYFSVYGPRQRPDEALHRLIAAALTGEPFPLFGDGSQIRDYTYVDDVVEATVAAARTDVLPGTTLNVAGGGHTTAADLVALVGELTNREIAVERLPEPPGERVRIGAAIQAARAAIGWSPRVGVRDGVARQLAWQRGTR